MINDGAPGRHVPLSDKVPCFLGFPSVELRFCQDSEKVTDIDLPTFMLVKHVSSSITDSEESSSQSVFVSVYVCM